MKKQWIAEALYIIVAVAFIGIYIGFGKEGEQEVFGTNVTDTPGATPTPAPGKAGNETLSPTPGQAQELTSAPVQDTIPTGEPGQKTDETVTPVPGQTSDGVLTPAPGQIPE